MSVALSQPKTVPAPHETTFTIGYSTLDVKGGIKMLSILNFLQDAASEHAHHLKAAGSDLARKELAWVIHRYHIEIHAHPRWLDRIRILTRRASWKNLYEVRDIVMTSAPLPGAPLVTARMFWVMVKRSSQRPVRLDRFFSKDLLTGTPDPPPVLTPLPAMAAQADISTTFKVRMHDLDLNSHVNNAVYVVWALETLPGTFLDQYRPAGIDVIFHGQAFYGEKILSRTCMDTDVVPPVTRHALYKEKGETEILLTTLQVHWKTN